MGVWVARPWPDIQKGGSVRDACACIVKYIIFCGKTGWAWAGMVGWGVI